MANNLIQIKRSLTTSIPPSLANGELAFTANGDVLYIGSNGGIVAIGGKRNPGTLTANQSLVANSTSGIDKVIVANLVPTSVWANGAAGTAGDVLTSNGSAVYWKAPSAVSIAGSNTYVQFNDSGVANAVGSFTFDKTTQTLYSQNAVSTQYILATNQSRNLTTNYNSVSGAVGVATDLTVGASGSGGNIAVPASATINIGATTINSTVFTGTSNNSTYLGGYDVANVQSWITANSSAAYSNSMSDTLSRNGSYTGNNTFGGTNTVISSNLSVSSAKIFATSADLSVNTITITTDLTVNGNTNLGNNVTDTISVLGVVTGNLNPSANITYHLGNNSMRWAQVHTQNVHSVTGYFDGNVQISGDLLVSGNVTTTNVNSVVISDPMIYLAGNNYSSDLLDIGFAGNYNDGTNRHTGLFRDASDGGLYKLFYNLTQELSGNNTVDTGDASYRIATLNAYLSSSGLSTNGTHVAITANSTVNVAITANSLALAIPLSGTSGGTGLSSYTAEDILVANSSNGFRKLSLGTDGQVLQSNGSALLFDALDGGSF
jgi:fibronectin-binding autotransporter adhesin